jgi:hypothetical protein
MKHPTDSQLRSYLDGELHDDHVASCVECQTRLNVIRAQRNRVAESLNALSPTKEIAPRNALARLTNYQLRKGNETMLTKLFSPKFRPLWVGATAIVLALILLSFSPVREAFSAFLALFRVQQVAVVPFNPANVPTYFNNRDQKMDRFMSETAKTEKSGEPKSAANAAEAASLAGFSVRLPGAITSLPKISVQPSARTTAVIDLAKINSMLDAAAIKDVKLPANLNGATITIDVPKSVTATYDCPETNPDRRPSSDEMAKCVALTQMPSPVVTSNPSNIDPKPLGEAFLRVLGLSASEAKDFSNRIDWSTTLVIPVPTTDAASKDVTVDGVKGTLVTQTNRKQYVMIWLKNGVMYGLMGYGDEATATMIANSLK